MLYALTIVVAILLVLLLYPFRLDAAVACTVAGVKGWLKLRPLFLLPKPAITLWDSEAAEKAKKKKQKESEKEEKSGEAEKKDEKNGRKIDLSALLSDVFDLAVSGRRGIRLLPVRLNLQYSLVNPAHTAEIYGLIFAVLPIVFGGPKLKWRIRIDPLWTADAYCLFSQMRVTVNLGLLLIAFLPAMKKLLKMIWKYVRRKKHERTSHRTVDIQRVGES